MKTVYEKTFMIYSDNVNKSKILYGDYSYEK